MLFFYLALYGYYMVQFLAKSVEPFIIYRKVKYLTFDFDLKVTKLCFSYLSIYGYYTVQFEIFDLSF